MKQGLKRLICSTFFICFCTPSICPAQQPVATKAARAQRLEKEGQGAYADGHYERAATHFLDAHKMAPQPRLLLNTAHSYRKAKLFDRAVHYYKAYLDAYPGSPISKEVKALIASGGERVATSDATNDTETGSEAASAAGSNPEVASDSGEEMEGLFEEPPPGDESAGESRPFYKTWWFWTSVAAVVGAGVGFGVYAGTREPDYVKEGGLGSIRW